MGATFTLLLTLGSAAAAVWSVVEGMPPIVPVATGGMALISGFVVVKNDWPKVWNLLFGGK